MTFIRFLPAFGWFLLSLVLFCLPGSTIPRFPWLTLIYADKWIHILIFFIFCFLLSWPLRNSLHDKPWRTKRFLWITALGIAYGITIEFMQKSFIANRSFEILDILADTVGCLLAYGYSVRNFNQREGV